MLGSGTKNLFSNYIISQAAKTIRTIVLLFSPLGDIQTSAPFKAERTIFRWIMGMQTLRWSAWLTINPADSSARLDIQQKWKSDARFVSPKYRFSIQNILLKHKYIMPSKHNDKFHKWWAGIQIKITYELQMCIETDEMCVFVGKICIIDWFWHNVIEIEIN